MRIQFVLQGLDEKYREDSELKEKVRETIARIFRVLDSFSVFTINFEQFNLKYEDLPEEIEDRDKLKFVSRFKFDLENLRQALELSIVALFLRLNMQKICVNIARILLEKSVSYSFLDADVEVGNTKEEIFFMARDVSHQANNGKKLQNQPDPARQKEMKEYLEGLAERDCTHAVVIDWGVGFETFGVEPDEEINEARNAIEQTTNGTLKAVYDLSEPLEAQLKEKSSLE